MRIRTIKPEFWTHPVMGRQKPEVQLLALGLLNLADDHGYFLADAGLVRSALCPFSDSSRIVHGCITTLQNVGWIDVKKHPTHGPIGLVVNFRKHQIINREKPSKLAEYFEKCRITDESRTNHGLITDSSLPEQGTGNREVEQGSGKEQGALARNVFAYWAKVMGSKGTPTLARMRAVNGRLEEGFTEEELKAAIDGCARTPHNMGQNDRGTKFNDIELICRNAQNVERFMSATGPQAAKPTHDPNSGISEINRWVPGMPEYSGDM